jgi:hypothetical protein
MFLIGGNVKQRQRRFKRATRDVHYHEWKTEFEADLQRLSDMWEHYLPTHPVKENPWRELARKVREEMADVTGVLTVTKDWRGVYV